MLSSHLRLGLPSGVNMTEPTLMIPNNFIDIWS
jgi:hypothetical protein